jgi:hypothetical protein
MALITVINDGPLIRETNYFDTEHALAGSFYLSWNAGKCRLLMPDNTLLTSLSEMLTGKYVVISVGPWNSPKGIKAGIELMFEDNSDSPMSIHMTTEQSDRNLPDSDQGSGFTVDAVGRKGVLATWPGHFRKVKSLPWMKSWVSKKR